MAATAQVSGLRGPGADLRVAARTFYRFPTAVLPTASTLALTVARLAVADWSWVDAAVAGVIVAVQPFTEWLIHVTLLHARPFTILGRTWDLHIAVKHREHHADPRNLPLLFIPLRVLAYGAVAATVVSALMPSWPLRLTALLTMSAMTLVYEWTHYLIHSDYKPRTWFYRRLYVAHRLHHYRNEHYWYGVTRTLGDKVLGTSPGKDDVPVSATCRRLGEPV